MEKEPLDLEVSMRDLCDLGEKIFFRANENPLATEREKKMLTKKTILSYLKHYKNDFDVQEIEANKKDIRLAFKKYRASIMRGWKTDSLSSGGVSLYSVWEERDEKHRIAISELYASACKCREKTKMQLSGLPVEAYDDKEEFLYPTHFLLHFYRVLLCSLDGETHGKDITTIQGFVKEIEAELKIGKELEAAPVEVLPQGGLMDLAKDFATKIGITVPEGLTMPSQGNIMDMIGTVINNPSAQSMLGELAQEFKQSKDAGEGITRAFSKLQEPHIKENFAKMAESFTKPNLGKQEE